MVLVDVTEEEDCEADELLANELVVNLAPVD